MLANYKSPKDFHCHTKYCDGGNTPEEMIIEAIKKGMQTLGFSGHCYTFFDESYCMLPEECLAYETEVRTLAEKYKDKITVLCGVEQDYWSAATSDNWDYIIGSAHYVRCKYNGKPLHEGFCKRGDYVYLPVDESPEIWWAAVKEYFHGDPYAFVEAYFQMVGDIPRRTGCDLIGHLDLICKYNDGTQFDENHPRFLAAYKKAVDEGVKWGVPFEINTSALLKGYRDEPYPSRQIREYIKKCGGKMILSSDSHSIGTLCYAFEDFSGEVEE